MGVGFEVGVGEVGEFSGMAVELDRARTKVAGQAGEISDRPEGQPCAAQASSAAGRHRPGGTRCSAGEVVATHPGAGISVLGYRLMTVSASSIIDAAHIHQFADSRNNEIRNGLALCKNAQWLFDSGLWTIADDYTVRVALGHFTEDSPDQKRLADYDGQRIRLPGDLGLSPDPGYLDWHRRKRFLGAV